LRILNCGDNKLTSLKGIENLTNLVHLFYCDNQLTLLEGIENLVKLIKNSMIYDFDDYIEYHNNSFQKYILK
jgi:Leucine-rich repeat (LRR) protein